MKTPAELLIKYRGIKNSKPEYVVEKIILKMHVPINARTFETDMSVMWFDEDGILCSMYKKNAVLTKGALEKSFQLIATHSGGKKICWLGEVTNISTPDKETRDFAAAQTPVFVKALAILSYSPFANFIANIYLNLKKSPYPRKLFSNEIQAKNWLKQYL